MNSYTNFIHIFLLIIIKLDSINRGVFHMGDFYKYEKKIVPEMLELLEKRYNILKVIYYNEPIGRRKLSLKVGTSERIIRSEIEVLKDQNLVNVNLEGITITKEGEEILKELQNHIHGIRGLFHVEEELKEKLRLKKVIVVPGDFSADSGVFKELGKTAANFIKSQIKDGDIIALTGGSTVKEVVNNFPVCKNFKNVLVVPGRGGMGQFIETQSNTIVETLANKLGANYRLLYIPENLGTEAQDAILKEEAVKDTVGKIKKATILIHGIGIAEEMATKRELSHLDVEKIIKSKAVGEVFGLYFDREGNVVFTSRTIGIKFEDIDKAELPIAIACGREKADAVMSIRTNHNEKRILIIDEGLAEEILKKLD